MRRILRWWSTRLFAVVLTLTGMHVAGMLNESGLGQSAQAAVPARAAGPDSDGWLEARLALLPLDDPGRFDLAVTDWGGSLVAAASDLGHEGTTGAVVVSPGSYRVAVAGHDGTSLGLYITTIECRADAGRGPVVASCAHCTALDEVPIADGAAVVCTVTQVNAQPPLAVAIAQFEATCQGETPLLTWITEQEIDIQGFYLYRGASPSAPDTQLNSHLIPAVAPGSTQGQSYGYLDGNVAGGETYWYWLEDVSLSGVATMHGPVSVDVTGPTAVALRGISASPAAAAGSLSWLWGTALAGAALGVSRIRRRT